MAVLLGIGWWRLWAAAGAEDYEISTEGTADGDSMVDESGRNVTVESSTRTGESSETTQKKTSRIM